MKKKIIISAVVAVLILFLLKHFKGKSSKGIDYKKEIDEKVQSKIKTKFSMKNQEFLDTLHPDVKQEFINFVADITKMGYTPVITAAYRTFQRSAELKKENAKNASPGHSSHNYGMALDLVLVKGSHMIQKDALKAEWEATGVPQMAKTKYGMRWGGDFPDYADNVHFDLQNKYPTDRLLALAIAQFGSADKVEGNKVQLT